MAQAARKETREFREAQEKILRWRAGGPAMFAVEALGMPMEYDAKRGTGAIDWWFEASEKLVRKKRLSIRSGHGVSKSAYLSICILWFMACYFPCKIPCTAPTAHQLEDVLWAELAKWHRVLELNFPALASQFEWTRDHYRLQAAPKESFAVARTARPENPDALAGFHSDNLLIIVDEAPGVADTIFETGQGTLSTDGSFAILAGNPTRRSGFFFDTHHKLRDRWETMRVNGEECILVGKQFKDDIAHQYGLDSNVYRVRVLGDFPTAEDDVVIPLELCEAAKVRDVKPFGPPVWGVDIARFGKDRTVLVKRCTNATLEKHKSWSGQDTMQIAGRIFAEWNETLPEHRPANVFVDVIGIGAGVVDRLQELQVPVVGINVAEEASVSDTYLRSRDELWFRARKWLEKKDCKLVDDETLIAELSLPKYKVTSTGKLQVESKDDMKKRYPQSPDCFVAGTLVDTSSGPRRIETIRDGDTVSTPFGARKVVKVWESVADSITTVYFSNGAVLSGKGKHKIFTWDSGFVRLDALSLVNAIETNSAWRKARWFILNSLFAKASAFGFKRAVATIKRNGQITASDFYTVGYGLRKTAQFLKDLSFTIKTVIGQTMQFATFKQCQVQSMGVCTWKNDGEIRSTGKKQKADWINLALPQRSGTNQKLGVLGTKNMANVFGRQESQSHLLARFARQDSSLYGVAPSSAPRVVVRDSITSGTKQKLATAFAAVKSFISTSTAFKNVVPVAVQSATVSAKTYNLTLDRDNVYYANGILVANCADAFCLTFSDAAMHKGRQSYDPPWYEDA